MTAQVTAQGRLEVALTKVTGADCVELSNLSEHREDTPIVSVEDHGVKYSKNSQTGIMKNISQGAL